MFFVSEDISTCSTQRSSAAEMDGILSKLRSANPPRAGARPSSVKHFVIKCSYTEVHEPSWPPDEIFLVVGSNVRKGHDQNSARTWRSPEEFVTPSIQQCSSSGAGTP